MPDAKPENVKAKIGALKLKREILRELDAGELKHAQGGGKRSYLCGTERDRCTRWCPKTYTCAR